MPNMNLGKSASASYVLVETTGAPTSTGEQGDYVLDMAGYDSVLWIGNIDTVASTTGSFRLYHMHSNSTSTTDMVSCTGADYIVTASTAFDQSCIMLDVQKPLKRYVSVYLYKDVAARVNVVGLRYNARKPPAAAGTAAPYTTAKATAVSPST